MKICAALVAFLISGNKHLTRSDLRREGFLSAYSSRWHSPSLPESWQQEQVVADDLALIVRKQREMMLLAAQLDCLLVIRARTPALPLERSSLHS